MLSNLRKHKNIFCSPAYFADVCKSQRRLHIWHFICTMWLGHLREQTDRLIRPTRYCVSIKVDSSEACRNHKDRCVGFSTPRHFAAAENSSSRFPTTTATNVTQVFDRGNICPSYPFPLPPLSCQSTLCNLSCKRHFSSILPRHTLY